MHVSEKSPLSSLVDPAAVGEGIGRGVLGGGLGGGGGGVGGCILADNMHLNLLIRLQRTVIASGKLR